MAKYISTKIVNAAQWEPTDTEPMREFLADIKSKIKKISLVQEVKPGKLDTVGCLDPTTLSLSVETSNNRNAIVAKPTAYLVQTSSGLTSMTASNFEEQYKPDTSEETPSTPEEPSTTTTTLTGLSVEDYKSFVIDQGSKLTVKLEVEQDTTARSAEITKVEFEATQAGEDTVLTLLTKATSNKIGWSMTVDESTADVSFVAPGAYTKGSAIVAASRADGTEFFVSEPVAVSAGSESTEEPSDPDDEEGDLSTLVNKGELSEALGNAATVLERIKVSVDGSDVATTEQWTTQTNVDILNEALDAAQAVFDKEDATQDEVNEVTNQLNAAVFGFTTSTQAGTKVSEEPVLVSKTALTTAIAAAEAIVADANVSEDGSDVDPSEQWVSQDAVDALNGAITVAQIVADDADANQETVNEALDTLNAAIGAFGASKQNGTKEEVADKAALNLAIANAISAKSGVEVSSKNGTDVDRSKKWVTQAVLDALNEVIADAQATVDNEDATSDDISAAITVVNEAIATFNAAKKSGSYTEIGEGEVEVDWDD